MKSFKLGLPSLYGRKKSPAVIQKASVKEEVLTRNPTLPSKQMEVEQMDLVLHHVNTMVGAEEMEVVRQEVEMQDAGIAVRDSCHNSSLELPLPAADNPAQQLTSCQAVSILSQSQPDSCCPNHPAVAWHTSH